MGEKMLVISVNYIITYTIYTHIHGFILIIINNYKLKIFVLIEF